MTIRSSGQLPMSEINDEFHRGANLGAHHGVQWWTDTGATGYFSGGQIAMSDFYGKRSTSPAVYTDILLVGGGAGGGCQTTWVTPYYQYDKNIGYYYSGYQQVANKLGFGGGGGDVKISAAALDISTTYGVHIGGGGAGGYPLNYYTLPGNGGASTFIGITANGGRANTAPNVTQVGGINAELYAGGATLNSFCVPDTLPLAGGASGSWSRIMFSLAVWPPGYPGEFYREFNWYFQKTGIYTIHGSVDNYGWIAIDDDRFDFADFYSYNSRDYFIYEGWHNIKVYGLDVGYVRGIAFNLVFRGFYSGIFNATIGADGGDGLNYNPWQDGQQFGAGGNGSPGSESFNQYNGYPQAAGSGQPGALFLRYAGPQKFWGGLIQQDANYTYHIWYAAGDYALYPI